MPNKKNVTKKANAKKPSAKKAAAKKTSAKKPAVKKTTAKKTVTKKTAAKKPTVKKTAVKKTAAKKPTVKKTAAKKTVAKKTIAKKPTVKKTAAKKTVTKKPTVKKTVAKKTATKKPAAQKTVAKKPTVKKTAVEKTAAKKLSGKNAVVEKVFDEKIVDDILDVLNEDEGAMIPRPATDEDIADCQEDLVNLALEPLPQGYIDFLIKCNGLAWNGIEFYSTYQVSEDDNPTGFILMDLVTMNDDFNNNYELDEKVLLGRADEEYYTYNIETQKYEILELGSSEALEEYNTFAELFFDTVGARLGIASSDVDK